MIASTQLHCRLSSFGVLLLTISCLSPVVGVYGMGSDVLRHAGTGTAALFLIGIGAAVIWAIVYAELGSAYPYAGGDYVGVGSTLGPAAGFACLALWLVTTPPMTAYLAQRIVVDGGSEPFPMGDGIQASSLSDLCKRLTASREAATSR